MTPGQSLLLVLVLFYLSECFLWVDRGTVAFLSPWGGKWRALAGHSILGNVRGGLVFLNPLPPFGTVFCSHTWPISFSPIGVCARSLQSLPGSDKTIRPGRSVAFEDIEKAGTRDAWLTINGERFALCATTGQASQLVDLIRAAVQAPQDRREALIEEFLDSGFDRNAAATALTRAMERTTVPRWMCLFFFLFLYWLVPLASIRFGLVHIVLPAASGMFVAAWAVTAVFYRTHKRLYPSRRTDRTRNAVKMVLCPPQAIRAVDLLTAEAVARFNPVVVATLLPGGGAEAFVRLYMRDLKHPARLDGPDGSGKLDERGTQIAGWHAERLLGRCLAFLRDYSSLAPETLFDPPRREPDCTYYCPRCEGQFLTAWEECPDCPGVPLSSFDSEGDAS